MSTFESIHCEINGALRHKSVPRRFVTQLVACFREDAQEFTRGVQNAMLQFLPVFRERPESEHGLKVIIATMNELKNIAATHEAPEEVKSITGCFNRLLEFLAEGCEAKANKTRQGCVWTLNKLTAHNIQDALTIDLEIKMKLQEVTRRLLHDKLEFVRQNSVLLAAK